MLTFICGDIFILNILWASILKVMVENIENAC